MLLTFSITFSVNSIPRLLIPFTLKPWPILAPHTSNPTLHKETLALLLEALSPLALIPRVTKSDKKSHLMANHLLVPPKEGYAESLAQNTP